MIIRIAKKSDIPSSEITPEDVYINRRKFLGASAGIGAAAFLGCGAAGAESEAAETDSQDLEPTSWEDITTYNNFYEFGLDKADPARNAHTLVTRPWTIKVDGLCAKPGDYQLEDFVKPSVMEDRTYRFRCVEAWSMVDPVAGLPPGRRDRPRRARSEREIRRLRDAVGSGSRCRSGAGSRGSAGRTARVCGWTKR